MSSPSGTFKHMACAPRMGGNPAPALDAAMRIGLHFERQGRGSLSRSVK